MPISKVCVICGQGFSVKANRANTAKTCSNQCRGILQSQRYMDQRLSLECRGCGKEFKANPTRAKTQKFCTPECKHSHNRKETKCLQCGNGFWDYKSQFIHSPRHYCSKACSHKALRGGKDMVKFECETCGKEYEKAPYMESISRFCSKKCLDQSKVNQVVKVCANCGEDFSIPACRADKASFCSEACKWKSYTGNDDWVSPEGVSSWGYARSGTNGLQHREVMLAWLLEDAPDHPFLDYSGGFPKLGTEIDVHHIDRNRLNNDRSNLLAMPRDIHISVHHRKHKPSGEDSWPPDPKTF